MQLDINTSEEKVTIGLYDLEGNLLANNSWVSKHNESEVLVDKIEKMLKSESVSKDDLKRILICSGPGSYTALRVGISTANLIAYALNIPILSYKKNSSKPSFEELLESKTGDKFEKVALPLYKKAPHITAKKPRR